MPLDINQIESLSKKAAEGSLSMSEINQALAVLLSVCLTGLSKDGVVSKQQEDTITRKISEV